MLPTEECRICGNLIEPDLDPKKEPTLLCNTADLCEECLQRYYEYLEEFENDDE